MPPLRSVLLAAVVLICASAVAGHLAALENMKQAAGNKTDWFMAAQHGVFTHYLYSLQNNPNSPNSLGKNTTWDECVMEFDVEEYARSVAAANGRYAIFTMMQGTRYMIAPNSVYDNYTKYAPGEACSTRDLVEDLYQALAKRNIKLMLYWTGDGPHLDAQAAQALGWDPSTPDVFVQKWANVLQEYAQRYGSKVHGWWVDGCYQSSLKYTDEKLAYYKSAILAGNPNAIMAFNNGVHHPIDRTNSLEDYTCGESNDFSEVPSGRFVQDADQWHELTFLGSAWAQGGMRVTPEYLRAYAGNISAHQGVLTVDAQLFRNGSINAAQTAAIGYAFA